MHTTHNSINGSFNRSHSNCNRQPAQPSGLTEISLPNRNELAVLLPSFAYLTNQHNDRWLTWISQSPTPEREQLKFFGFNLSRMRIITAKDEDQVYSLTKKALAEGNSHTVVGLPGHLTAEQSRQLEDAAIKGQCVGLILKNRQH